MFRLNQLVRRLAGMLWAGILFIYTPLLRLFGLAFGHWQAPNWVNIVSEKVSPPVQRIGQWSARHAALSLLIMVLAALALAAPRLYKFDWSGKWRAMQSVQPDRAEAMKSTVNVSNPLPSDLENGGKPQPVVLQFSASVAPLSLIGKEAKDISVAPSITGKWLWVAANRLEFTPNEEWPIDVDYQVNFGTKALAAHIQSEREVTFHSPRFEIKMNDASFYQDPVQLGSRKAVFELRFSHPVNPDTLEKNLELLADTEAKAVFVKPGDEKKLNVTYDKFRLSATVMSESLRIPPQTLSMAFKIKAGVKAQRGGNATSDDIVKALSIPGLYSLDIVEMKQLMVTGDDGEPENVLQISTGMAVNEKEMTRSISAWLLPATRVNDEVGGENDQLAWSDPAEVTDLILKNSTMVPLLALPSERENSETHGFKFKAEPGRMLFVRIKKGLKSAGGYQLGVQRDELFRIKM